MLLLTLVHEIKVVFVCVVAIFGYEVFGPPRVSNTRVWRESGRVQEWRKRACGCRHDGRILVLKMVAVVFINTT